MRKDGESRAASAKMTREEHEPGSEAPLSGEPLAGLVDSRMMLYATQRDSLLDDVVFEAQLPMTPREYSARDPFSEDLMELSREYKKVKENAGRIDEELRADLLAKPHLMQTPDEAGLRGAAAVWRSLREQLRQGQPQITDTSGGHELLMLKREIEARKALVDAVSASLDSQLKRISQRLRDLDSSGDSDVAPGETGSGQRS